MPASEPSKAAEPQQYLTFGLGGQTLALGILRIKEIIEFGQLTAVPMMPPFIRGVINLRGAVVPVVDLQARFGRAEAAVSRRTCIVIVELRSAEAAQDVGVMVDQVNEVVEIAPGDIEPPPAFGAGLRTDFISGMGKLGSRFVIILDVDSLLSIEEMARAAAEGTAH